eukprot:c23472_g1_i4 orf=767-1780(+)
MMVVNSPVSKLKKLSMMDALDVAFQSLNILSPSSKLPAEEALSVEAGQGAEDFEEDTKSFSEDDFLFIDGADGEDDCVSHFSKEVVARPNSAHLRPNSAHHLQEQHGISCEFNNPHTSDDIHHMRLHADMHPGCEPFELYNNWSLPIEIPTSSPTTASLRKGRRAKKSSLSVRESLLAEAWERKRELMLNEELANVKECTKPELLGRSSSDCGKLIVDVQAAPSELRRSQTRSLTNDDFEELRGCIDLGFRFDQSSIPDLCDTLPALEVYCAVAQNLQESPNCVSLNSPGIQSPARCSSPSPSPSWRISSPGDDPNDVKGRLRHWAQAVACNAKLCY